MTTRLFGPNSGGVGSRYGLRLSTLEQLDVGSVAKVVWDMERKRVANRLWRHSTFDFLDEGVVHDRNNGNSISSKDLLGGLPCRWNVPKVLLISASSAVCKSDSDTRLIEARLLELMTSNK